MASIPVDGVTVDVASLRAAATDARLCHALAVCLDGARTPEVAAEQVRRAAGLPQIWSELVPAPAGSAVAKGARERELCRPVFAPGPGPGVRGVLLRTIDGRTELVLVAHRAAVSPASLSRIASFAARGRVEETSDLLGESDRDPRLDAAGLAAALTRADRLAPPDWGLGSADGPAFAAAERSMDGARLPSALELTAAAALVLSRSSGRQQVEVAELDPRSAVAFDVDPQCTVADFLCHVHEASREADGASARAAEPALVSVARIPRGLAETRLFLAPVHPLQITITEGGDRAAVSCQWSRRHFDDRVAERFASMVLRLARTLGEHPPEAALRDVELFDADQRLALRQLGGAGRRLCGPARRIDQVVADRARALPERVAVSCAGQQLSYREVVASADAAARVLQARGVRPGDRVGVCMERSVELVVTLLAVLTAGAAYVPLDPGYPEHRLAFTVEDAGIEVVVTDVDAFPVLAGVRPVRPAELLEPAGHGAQADESGLRCAPRSPEDIAYVIYTSGSTGRPKGVPVPHSNVSRLLEATERDFALNPDDVWTFFHSVAFDFSVWEIWGALMTGARLVVVPYWVSRTPEEFHGLLASEKVSVLNQTPGAFAQLSSIDRDDPLAEPPRLVIFGGETLDTAALRSWLDRHPERDCRLVNMFGITETTVHVTAQDITRADVLAQSRSVGWPLTGWNLAVRDPNGKLLPPGAAGEIYVGGAGVARQYLNLQDMTADRFRLDPDLGATDGLLRTYRSGDLGRLLPDGRLEHLGRIDSQVKLRGHRIELDEIRGLLLEDPAVATAIVVSRQPDPDDPASARLDAFVVPASAEVPLDTRQIRERLAAFLPAYMVPSNVSALAALPLTANGKVDIGRLPGPVTEDQAQAGVQGHDGSLPEAVRAVWTRIFGVAVRPDDDFFGLGGNSLLAVRLLTALRAEHLPPSSVRELYLTPRVQDFTERLARAAADAEEHQHWLRGLVQVAR